MTAQTAKVEVLQAAVRVLMVGSRQVTLSVYRQLDAVSREAMEPFGRIRDGQQDGLWLVGVHNETGDLVKARSRDGSTPDAPDSWAHFMEHQEQRARWAAERRVDFRGQRQYVGALGEPAADGYTPKWKAWGVDHRALCPEVAAQLDVASGVVPMREEYVIYSTPIEKLDVCPLTDEELLAQCRPAAELAYRQVLAEHQRYMEDGLRPLIVLAGLR